MPQQFVNEQNHYQGGALHYACVFFNAILLADLVYLTFTEYRRVRKQELVIPFMVVAAIAFSYYLDSRLGRDTPIESYLTIAIVSCCLLYYIWLHMQFVRDEGLVRVSTRQTAAGHEIEVWDNGDGFDPGKLTEGDRQHLGIWNVRERLERMCGGTLDIDSGSGSGTTVTITLPLTKEEEDHAGNLRR